MKTLLNLSLQRNRDLLHARSRIRRIAAMLGFDPLEQAKIAGVAFELACRNIEDQEEIYLSVQIAERRLSVSISKQPNPIAPNLTATIPENIECMSEEDLIWSLNQLEKLDSLNLFEELRRHNQDLICALTLLHQSERLIAEHDNLRSGRHAA